MDREEQLARECTARLRAFQEDLDDLSDMNGELDTLATLPHEPEYHRTLAPSERSEAIEIIEKHTNFRNRLHNPAALEAISTAEVKRYSFAEHP